MNQPLCNPPALTLFYDGFCPLCVNEMATLTKLDRSGNLQLVDIQNAELMQNFPQIDVENAGRILTGQTANSQLVLGLDATHAAWSAVGKGHRTAWLRWPVIRFFADKAYLWFAANRYRVSYWLTGKSRLDNCSNGYCATKPK